MTQADLAELCGVSTETIGRLERGTQLPSIGRLSRIANAIGVDLAEMLTEHKAPPKDAALRKLLGLLANRTPEEIDLVTEIARVVVARPATLSDRSPKATRRGG